MPGGHIRLEFADEHDLERAAARARNRRARRRRPGAPGRQRWRRRFAASLLDTLDAAAVDVGALSVRTPDLDDVFLSLTASPDDAKVVTR